MLPVPFPASLLQTTDSIDLTQHHRDPHSAPVLQQLDMNTTHLLAITQSQVFCFDMPNFNSTAPHVIGFPASTVVLCVMAERHFLMVLSTAASAASSSLNAVVFTYDGKQLAQINLSAIFSNVNTISRANVALNNHYVAVVEGLDGKRVLPPPAATLSPSYLPVLLLSPPQ
jgi:hypothetical protein